MAWTSRGLCGRGFDGRVSTNSQRTPTSQGDMKRGGAGTTKLTCASCPV